MSPSDDLDPLNTEYFRLLEQYQSDLYGQNEDVEEEEEFLLPFSVSDVQIRSMEKNIREKTMLPVLNLTEATLSEIEEKIHSPGFLRVYDFLLRITNYRAISGQESTLSLDVFRGQGSGSAYGFRLISRHNFKKDLRFSETPLPKMFSVSGFAINLKIKEVIEVIRWIQIVERCVSFL